VADDSAPFSYRDSIAFSDTAIELGSPRDEHFDQEDGMRRASGMGFAYPQTPYTPDKGLFWNDDNAEIDDYLHDPSPGLDRMLDRQWARWSLAGLLNTGALGVLVSSRGTLRG
jgi:hypothetical protein